MRISFPFVLAVLLAFGVGWYMISGDLIVGGRGANETSPAPPAERVADEASNAVRVRADVVRASQRIQTLDVRGRTVADASVAVAAETTGRVVARPVQLGQRVEKGDLLCQLDRGAREARVGQAEATLEQATSDLEAAEQLNEKGFTTDIRVKALKAQFDTAKAALREARLELERTEVLSPIDGVAESDLAEVGSMLSAGATCALVMNPNPMLVIGQVSERDVGKLRTGMTSEIKLVTGQTRAGEITFIGTAADEETRTFRIEISVPNDEFDLRSGVTAHASIKLP